MLTVKRSGDAFISGEKIAFTVVPFSYKGYSINAVDSDGNESRKTGFTAALTFKYDNKISNCLAMEGNIKLHEKSQTFTSGRYLLNHNNIS